MIMLRNFAIAAAVIVAAPAVAQVRVTVNGESFDVPAGTTRVITYLPSGKQQISDRQWDGQIGTEVASGGIVITETVEEDDHGRILSRKVATQFEPQRVAYTRRIPTYRQAIHRHPAYVPPRLIPDLSKLSETQPPSMPGVMRIKRDGRSGHFIANIRINGVAIKAIIDTGATYTLLTPEAAHAVGAYQSIIRNERAVGIGGMATVAVARLRTMEVAGQQFGSMIARIGQRGIAYTLLGQTEIARLGRVVIEDGVMTIIPQGAQ
ncbi:clan AA aspartic protease [Sphingomonas sp. CFBP 13714]|uniref:retropepsin-like aspartic protease family protein n=1 Tax=Sphingomonas sp. CFBP 13714 TaxID=2775308 RepID=UPI001782D203|nr:retropepsin-like aspartic protease [Sphingomonas sp. CFBP 13714]MBD8702020.1 clan AA aspartic protease [Sphingomonas sp. CFBP 13714]